MYTKEFDFSVPWTVWTPQQRSYVVEKGYQNRLLSDHEIKVYLQASRAASLTNWALTLSAIPLSVMMRPLAPLFAVAAFGVWKLNPLITKRENQKEKTLAILYQRVGLQIKSFNDKLPRSDFVDEIDRRTRRLYHQRNGLLTGWLFPQNDATPPIIVEELKHNKILK